MSFDKSQPIRDIVKDETWQKVRTQLLGKWKSEPQQCCKLLRDYLGNISKTSDTKLRIVMNYLTGTGFRTGKIKHDCISQLRTQISVEMKVRKYHE